MVCFCCFDCCMPSKDSNTQFRRRESAGCFHCSFLSSEWKARKREDRGIGCLCLGEPSSSSNVDSPQKSRCFSCKKSLKKDMNGEGEVKEKKLFNCFKSTKKERKVRKGPSRCIECLCCGECFSKDGSPKSKSCCFSGKKSLKKEEKDKKCFSCFRLFREVEERSSERGNSCMCFRASSMKDESSKKQGCQCLPHKKSSKEHIEPIGGTNKGCFSCFRSSNKEGDEKKSCCKVGCFCCGKLSSKVEPSETSGCCCLSHKNSLKEYPKSRGKDMIGLCSFRSRKVDSSNKENVGTSCDNEISKEDSPKKEGGTTCFSCRTGTSKENLSKKVGGICFCFKCHNVKLLKDPVLVDTGKQKKKSKDVLLKKRRGKIMCCCILSSTESLVERKSTSKTKCTLSCFFCIQSKSYQKSSLNKRKWDLSCLHMKEQSQHGHHLATPTHTSSCISENDAKNRPQVKEILPFVDGNSAVQVFMYKEIVAATKNFSEDRLLGSGVFGRVYKGEFLGKNEVVTVKQLMGNENHISNEFLVDLVTLSLLHHPNLIKLLGYCAERDQMILVYEYMAFGSLQDHLFDIEPNAKLLDWPTRMKIAAGAAKGLEYLHDVANPPMIYQDMKASNILLDENYNPKLSDFGLEKPKRVMGTYGCCAPEYAFTRKLTKTTDVYSFGVLLLELITGRKAIDTTRKKNEQYLAHWAAPLFKDKRKLLAMADPLLNGNFPVKDLYQALAIANMCLQYEASSRPLMSDVVTAIEYLATPERVSSDPLEEPEVSQNTSDDEKPKLQSFHRNGPLRTSIASFETFQSISSDIESCGTPREEDDQDED